MFNLAIPSYSFSRDWASRQGRADVGVVVRPSGEAWPELPTVCYQQEVRSRGSHRETHGYLPVYR